MLCANDLEGWHHVESRHCKMSISQQAKERLQTDSAVTKRSYIGMGHAKPHLRIAFSLRTSVILDIIRTSGTLRVFQTAPHFRGEGQSEHSTVRNVVPACKVSPRFCSTPSLQRGPPRLWSAPLPEPVLTFLKSQLLLLKSLLRQFGCIHHHCIFSVCVCFLQTHGKGLQDFRLKS